MPASARLASPPRNSYLLGGRVKLAQPTAGYRVAIDPVFLAAAVPAKPGETLLELGCGSGAAALCLLTRVPDCRVDGLELQPELAELARQNAAANGFRDRFTIFEGDLLTPPAGISRTYDQVFFNPPYQAADRSSASSHTGRAKAHQESHATLADWLEAALSRLRPGGRVTVIHRADRLDELLALLDGRAGSTVVIPLWPRADRPAKRIIVLARRDRRGPLSLEPGLVLHDEAAGAFSPAAEAILRHGQALEPATRSA